MAQEKAWAYSGTERFYTASAGSGRAPFRVRARYLPIDAFLEGFEISEQTEI